jgi:hypothetical protein|tara:strand:+ start:757 stop:1131 length:375 start_codon:yes stop_codon:yes gene_type:complete
MDLSDNIDILTFELMGNKKKVKNYLRKNGGEIEKINYESELINIHRDDIMNVTEDLLNGVEESYTEDVKKSFEYYKKNIIKYIEMKKVKKENNFNYNDDEDMLFGNMEENKKEIKNYYGYEFRR